MFRETQEITFSKYLLIQKKTFSKYKYYVNLKFGFDRTCVIQKSQKFFFKKKVKIHLYFDIFNI